MSQRPRCVSAETMDGVNHRAAEILLIGVMPFLYGVATRLPFIYFVIHLNRYFELDMLYIGFCVAMYQSARVLTSALSTKMFRFSHLMGTAIGLAGFLTVLVSSNGSLFHFVGGTAAVGFSETMSSMQKYAKEMYETETDPEKRNAKLKYQYGFVMFGVGFGFFVGGFVYQFYNINGVALFGVIVESLGLVALVLFFAVSPKKEKEDKSKTAAGLDAFDSTAHASVDAPSSSCRVAGPTSSIESNINASEQILHQINNNDIPAAMGESEPSHQRDNGSATMADYPPGVTLDMDSMSEEDHAQRPSLDFTGKRDSPPRMSLASMGQQFSSSSVTEGDHPRKLNHLIKYADQHHTTNETLPVTWVNWIMCISFGIEALTIGYNLSIGPIFMLEEFKKQTGIIGVMFAVGAGSGCAAAISVTCTSLGRKALGKIARSPFDICFAMAGIATGVFVAAVPSFPVHVCGIVLLMGFNDLGATLMTELQASITTTSNYSFIGPLGQVVRRSLNVVTALTGPVLFGVYPRLPYFVAGGITLIWSVVLFVVFKKRVKCTVEKISMATGSNRDLVSRSVSFGMSESVRATLKSTRSLAVAESTNETAGSV